MSGRGKHRLAAEQGLATLTQGRVTTDGAADDAQPPQAQPPAGSPSPPRSPTARQLRELVDAARHVEATALLDGIDLEAEFAADFLYYAAVCLGSQHQDERAIGLLRRAAEGGFAPFWCAFHLGLFEARRGRTAEAAYYYAASLILDAARHDLYPLLNRVAPGIDLAPLHAAQTGTRSETAAGAAFDLGRGMLDAGNRGAAAFYFATAIVLAPRQADARDALLRLAPGVSLAVLPLAGEEPAAGAAGQLEIEELVGAAPANASRPSLMRLQQLTDAGQHREALALLRGVDLTAVRPDMQYLAAVCLGGVGQTGRAIELLICALDSGFPAFWCAYHLGLYEERRGNAAKAGFYYAAALILEPARADLWPLLERIAPGTDLSPVREAQSGQQSAEAAREAFRRGMERLGVGNPGAAAGLFGAALALDPLHAEARARLLELAPDLAIQCVTGVEFDRIAAEMRAQMEDPAADLDDQLAAAAWANAVFSQTWHASGVALIPTLERVLRNALEAAPQVGLDRLCGLYETLYFLYFYMASHQSEMRGFGDNVVRPFAAALRDGSLGGELSAATRRPLGDKPLRLGYLSQYASDNAVGFFADRLLRALSRHFPDSYRLALYAWREYDSEWLASLERSGVLVRRFMANSTVECAATVGEAIAADAIDILITDQNTWLPTVLFERRVAPVQIHNNMGGLPFWPLENVDAILRIDVDDPSVEGVEIEKCFPVGLGPWDVPWLAPDIDPALVSAERARFQPSVRLIGNYGRLAKITPDFMSVAAELVSRHPDLGVVIGGQGNGAWIRDFIVKRGLEKRIHIVDEWVEGHVWGYMMDVFLDSFPTQGGMSRREMMAKGRPVVSMQSSWTQFEGVPVLIARDRDAYIDIVSRLLTDPEFYRSACEATQELVRSGMNHHDYAAAVDDAITTVVCRMRRSA